jgi:Ca2+/H+ antiporter, TMEM165/GDT1 family
MTHKFGKRKWMFIPIFIAAVFLFGAIVMGLWNAILPAVIGVKAINLWQALGILALSKILFGGFRGGWRGRHGKERWMEMQQKLAAMSPEEKDKFKAEWRNRCKGWKMREQDSAGTVTE